jgi:hypothetical protein
MSCGADTTANTLLTALTAGKNFTLPTADMTGPLYQIPDGTGDLFDAIDPLTNEDLTTRVVGGNGVFDALMDGLGKHLKKEYEANRITGEQYTKAYSAAVGGALQTGTSFLLGRDQAYWAAIQAQMQARLGEIQVVTARVQLEIAKVQLNESKIRTLTAEAEFGLTKIKIASEDQGYCLLKAQTVSVEFQNEFMLPSQLNLLNEQIEVQRGQTLDTRTNGAAITGSVGKQKDLYSQQIISYQRDAEVKAAKLFTDAWITQKTIDESLAPPGAFRNDSVNVLLRTIKQNNSMVADPGAQPGDPD